MSRRVKKALWIALASTLVVLVGPAVALPSLLRAQINKSLAVMPDGYRGSVREVGIRPFAGAVVLEGFRIEKADGSVKTPFLTAEALRVSLVEGRHPLELELSLIEPRINWIDATDPQRAQWGPPIDPAELKRQLVLPLKQVRVVDGELHLRNFSARPQIDVYASHVNASFDHLSDCLPPAGPCHASLDVKAAPMGHASLELSGSLVHEQSFNLALEGALAHLDLPALNPALLHYGDLDVKEGTLDLHGEFTQRGEAYRADIRPMLDHVAVLPGADRGRNIFREIAAGLVLHYLERRSGRAVIRLAGTSGKDDLHFDLAVDRTR